MKTVTLEQLDPSTSAWLREASRDEPVTITDHGTPIITLTPVPPAPRPNGGFANRVLRPGFEAIMNRPVGGTSIDEIIAQDREDRL